MSFSAVFSHFQSVSDGNPPSLELILEVRTRLVPGAMVVPGRSRPRDNTYRISSSALDALDGPDCYLELTATKSNGADWDYYWELLCDERLMGEGHNLSTFRARGYPAFLFYVSDLLRDAGRCG